MFSFFGWGGRGAGGGGGGLVIGFGVSSLSSFFIGNAGGVDRNGTYYYSGLHWLNILVPKEEWKVNIGSSRV